MPKREVPRGPIRQRADWSDLHVFYCVASYGTFVAAGQALGVGQSTVSKRIEDLEIRLNTRLFNRGPQGVTLTEAGRSLFDKVKTMERAAEDIEAEIANADRREEGQVGIAAPDGMAGYILGPAFASFFHNHPKITVALDCGLWPADKIPNAVDISLQFDETLHADFTATRLAQLHYRLFGSRAYLDLYGRPTSVQAAAAHRYIHHAAQNKQAESLPATTPALQQLALKPVVTNSSLAMVELIKGGSGIGPLPTAVLTVEPDLEMLDIGMIASVTLWMSVRREVEQSARVQRVAEWLKQTFDGRTRPWFRAEFVHPRDFGDAIQPARPALVAAAGEAV
ncbi:MAG TPA: LysR family transcriptional regulator [Caulobacteraceae bacterium]|jgi:DNA-binding transcriptional LysR family regulator|nr:LysR family transcriptional regulator [Caulobacteraceae bacterium]